MQHKKVRMRNRKKRELALLQAAASLFSEKGMHNTTTREISNKAGCAEGLIARYFQGKSGLAQAAIDRADELAIQSTNPIPDHYGISFLINPSPNFSPKKQQIIVNRIKAAIRRELELA